MSLVKRIARHVLRNELIELREAGSLATYFELWRRSSMCWEKYARELHAKHPEEETFRDWYTRLAKERPEEFKPGGVLRSFGL